MISGLLSVKPKNTPVVGTTRSFKWEEKVGSSGNPYIKVNSAAPDKGGTPCQIIRAEPTGYTDSHGNISFNVDLQPVDQTGVPQVPNRPSQPPPANGTPVKAVNVKAQLAKAAYLLHMCHRAAEAYGMDDGEDARSLFIHMTREGLHNHLQYVSPADAKDEDVTDA